MSRPIFLGRLLVARLVGKRLVPFDGLLEALLERRARLPAQVLAGLLDIGVPVLNVPLSLGHREGRLRRDVEQLAGHRGDLADRGLAARADVERLAVVGRAQVERGVDECLGHVVDIDEITRDGRIDEIGVVRLQAAANQVGNQPGRVFERAENRVEAQVRAREMLSLAVVVDQVGRGDLGHGVVAVGSGRVLLRAAQPPCRRIPRSCPRARSRRSTRASSRDSRRVMNWKFVR